jgi:hypothetical protein
MVIWHLSTTVIEINEQLHSPDGQKCGGAGVAILGGTVGYSGHYYGANQNLTKYFDAILSL